MIHHNKCQTPHPPPPLLPPPLPHVATDTTATTHTTAAKSSNNSTLLECNAARRIRRSDLFMLFALWMEYYPLQNDHDQQLLLPTGAVLVDSRDRVVALERTRKVGMIHSMDYFPILIPSSSSSSSSSSSPNPPRSCFRLLGTCCCQVYSFSHYKQQRSSRL